MRVATAPILCEVDRRVHVRDNLVHVFVIRVLNFSYYESDELLLPIRLPSNNIKDAGAHIVTWVVSCECNFSRIDYNLGAAGVSERLMTTRICLCNDN